MRAVMLYDNDQIAAEDLIDIIGIFRNMAIYCIILHNVLWPLSLSLLQLSSYTHCTTCLSTLHTAAKRKFFRWWVYGICKLD